MGLVGAFAISPLRRPVPSRRAARVVAGEAGGAEHKAQVGQRHDLTGGDGTVRGDAHRHTGGPVVRAVEGYPGVGSAPAFDEVMVLRPGEPQRRHVRVHVLDGRLGDGGIDDARDVVTQVIRAASSAITGT